MGYSIVKRSIGPTWITIGWWLIFGIEPLICLGTALYMITDPDGYLQATLGQISNPHQLYPLTQQYASVIFSAYVLYLALILWTPCPKGSEPERRRCFDRLQWVMFVGDVCLVVTGIGQCNSTALVAALGTIIMASFWGGLRLVYLLNPPPITHHITPIFDLKE